MVPIESFIQADPILKTNLRERGFDYKYLRFQTNIYKQSFLIALKRYLDLNYPI